VTRLPNLGPQILVENYLASDIRFKGRYDVDKGVCSANENERLLKDLEFGFKYAVKSELGLEIESTQEAFEFVGKNFAKTVAYGAGFLGAHLTPGLNAVVTAIEAWMAYRLATKTLDALSARAKEIDAFCAREGKVKPETSLRLQSETLDEYRRSLDEWKQSNLRWLESMSDKQNDHLDNSTRDTPRLGEPGNDTGSGGEPDKMP
jgi:hypothetical protein